MCYKRPDQTGRAKIGDCWLETWSALIAEDVPRLEQLRFATIGAAAAENSRELDCVVHGDLAKLRVGQRTSIRAQTKTAAF